MRTAAEVGEGPLRVGRDMPVFKVVNQFALVVLTPLAELLERIGFGDGFLHQLFFARTQLHHLCLNSGEVAILNHLSLSGIDIIVETILNSRTYTELNTRIQLLQRLRHQVRRGVPEGVLRLGVVPFVQTDVAVLGKRRVQLRNLPIIIIGCLNTGNKNVLCQTTADTLSHLQRRYAALILTDTTVRKSNFNHNKPTNVYGAWAHNCSRANSGTKLLLFSDIHKLLFK